MLVLVWWSHLFSWRGRGLGNVTYMTCMHCNYCGSPIRLQYFNKLHQRHASVRCQAGTIKSHAIVTLARSIVEFFRESKIQDKLKRAVYHTLIIIFHVPHREIIIEPYPKLLNST